MKIYILTQEDSLYLPLFFDRFLSELPSNYTLCGVSLLKGEIASKNIRKYLHLLGMKGVLKASFLFLLNAILDKTSRLIKLRRSYSVKWAFLKNGIEVRYNESINNFEFVDYIKNQNIDLLISVACPQIIKKRLRESVRFGAINIHGSLLPRYRGMLPSFWVLLNQENETGVSVHYVNEKIDDGPIISQQKVEILPNDSMHSLLLRSKIKYGPKLLVDSLSLIGLQDFQSIPNDKIIATYYSFPDKISIDLFHKMKKRVI